LLDLIGAGACQCVSPSRHILVSYGVGSSALTPFDTALWVIWKFIIRSFLSSREARTPPRQAMESRSSRESWFCPLPRLLARGTSSVSSGFRESGDPSETHRTP